MQVPQDASMIEWEVATRMLPTTNESGDHYLVKPFHPSGRSQPSGILVAVIDGLGHGLKAAAAAKQTIAALENHAHESLVWLFEHCHHKLRKTRGVVMSLASFNTLAGTMMWLGVGNVEGILLRAAATTGSKNERMLLRGGIVGYRLPTLRPAVIPISQGDTLVFATDGLRSSFAEALTPNGSPQQIANRTLAHHYRGTDDALILVARYVGHKDI